MTAGESRRAFAAFCARLVDFAFGFRFVIEPLVADIFRDSRRESYRAAPGGQPRAAVPTFSLTRNTAQLTLVSCRYGSGLRLLLLQSSGRRNTNRRWGVRN